MTDQAANTPPPAFSLRPVPRGTETSSVAEIDGLEVPESDVGLAVLLLAGILLAFFLARRLRSRPSEYKASAEAAPNPPPVNLSPKSRRFEAESAQPIAKKRCIEGSARVTDGDTIVIKKTQIRLFGIDAPELNHPYGQKAKWAMVRLCKGQKIRAEITDVDAYGRTVARCYLPDGRDLSAELVKQGLAIDWPKFSGGVYRSLEVEDARRKMWLANARQNGKMYLWEQYEYKQLHAKRRNQTAVASRKTGKSQQE